MGGAALLLLGLSCLLTSCDNAGDDAYLYKKVTTTTSTTTPLPGEGDTPGGMGKPSDGNPNDGNPNGNPDPHGNGVSHDFNAF